MLAKLYLEEENIEKAIKTMEEAVSLNPEAYNLHAYLGELYLWDGKHELSVNSLIKAINSKPDFPDAYRVLAQIYLSGKELTEDLSGSSVLNKISLSHLHKVHNEAGETLEDLQSLTELLPDYKVELLDQARLCAVEETV